MASTKKDNPSNANGKTEDVAEAAHQTRPEQAHLETEHGSRDRTDGEQHRRHLRPPPRQAERHRVGAHDAAPVHHEDDRRKRHPETGQHDVPAQ